MPKRFATAESMRNAGKTSVTAESMRNAGKTSVTAAIMPVSLSWPMYHVSAML